MSVDPSTVGPITSEQAIERIDELMPALGQVLKGEHPFVMGALLGKALALWLAGHPDFMRENMIAHHITYVRGLLPDIEKLTYDGKGHPQNRGSEQ